MTKQYVTNDIFRASGLVAKTELWPDGYYQTGETHGGRPVIYMAWDAMPVEYIEQLEAGQLLICPVQLSQIYRKLRGKLIEQYKDKTNERTPTLKTS